MTRGYALVPLRRRSALATTATVAGAGVGWWRSHRFAGWRALVAFAAVTVGMVQWGWLGIAAALALTARWAFMPRRAAAPAPATIPDGTPVVTYRRVVVEEEGFRPTR